MQITDGKTEINYCGKTAVAIGKFDGIHVGHRKLIQEMIKAAGKEMKTVVFTFGYRSSASIMREKKKILTQEEKRIIFEKLGIDILVEFDLDEEAASMSPEQFIEDILVKRLHAGFIVAGSDVSFGYRGAGNVHTLELASTQYQFKFTVIEKMYHDGRVISSTRIRECISNGDMENAKSMLGVPFYISGTVSHGKGIGSAMEVPTANLTVCEDKLLPPKGVYFSKTCIDGEYVISITNIGVNPTFGSRDDITIETYILNANYELYNKEISVQLLKFWRNEQAFESPLVLKGQINKDIRARKEYKD